MALKARIDEETHASLDPTIQSEYKKDDDGFVLDVESVEGYGLGNIGTLETTLGKVRKDKREAEAKLKLFKDMDAEEAREALEFHAKYKDVNLEDLSEREARLKEKYEGDIKKLKTDHKVELDTARNETKSVEGELTRTTVRSQAAKAIANAKGSVELLLPIVEGRVRARRDGDRRVVEVLGADGEPRMSTKPGSTDLMSIDELVEEMRKDDKYLRAFDGVNASGSGADANSRHNTSSTVRISGDAAKDPRQYRAAKAEAEKTGREFVVEAE